MDKTKSILVLVLVLGIVSSASAIKILPEISARIDIDPTMSIHSPGDRIKSVSVVLFDGELPIKDAIVTGYFDSVKPLKLSFEQTQDGTYTADVNYVMPNDENKIIKITANVQYMGEQKSITKWLYVYVPEYFRLLANKPTDGDSVAPGQNLKAEAQLMKVDSEDRLENINIGIVDLFTLEMTPMDCEQTICSTTIKIPADVAQKTNYLIVAEADVNDEHRFNYYELELNREEKLALTFDRSHQDTKSGRIALDIRYINSEGELVGDNMLDATVVEFPSQTSQNIVLKRDGGVYVGTFTKSKEAESAEITVLDQYENVGKKYLPSEFFKDEIVEEEIPIMYILIILVVIVAAIVVSVFARKSGKVSTKNNYKELEKQGEELKRMIAETKKSFYKQQISEETANRTITEYEEKISLINKQMQALKEN